MFLTFARRSICSVLCFLCCGGMMFATAQTFQDTAQPEPQLSPQAAYEQATRPLEITRRAPQNWSEIELAALKTARANAKAACAARNPEQFSGKDLLALTRLCAFALEWGAVNQAASNYLAGFQSAHPSDPSALTDLAMAFDYKVQACLNLQKQDEALTTAQTMLRTVPYDVYTSEATTSAIEAIRFTQMDQALALLKQRQPIVLSFLKGPVTQPVTPESAAAAPSAPSALPAHVLYADALALPWLLQFANKPEEAAAAYAELQVALPHDLSSDEAMFVKEKQRQYQLLGAHLPMLKPMGSLLVPGAPAPNNLNTFFANASVFLLFPDWCNQCVTLAFNSAQKGRDMVSNYEVRLLSLIAQAEPPAKPAEAAVKNVPLSQKAAKAALAQSQSLHVDQQLTVRSSPDSLLEGTPTVVVPTATLSEFAADDFPLVVVTDRNGIVRWIQRASDNTFAGEGEIDKIVQHVLQVWR